MTDPEYPTVYRRSPSDRGFASARTVASWSIGVGLATLMISGLGYFCIAETARWDQTIPAGVLPESSPTPAPPPSSDPVVKTLVPFPSDLSPEWTSQLATLDAQFQGAADRDARHGFNKSVAQLNTSFQGALDRLLNTAMQGGHTDEALAIREAKERLAGGEPVPEGDDETAPASLEKVRVTYRAAFQKLEIERDAKIAPLIGVYLEALDTLRIEVTKAGQLDDAKKIIDTAALIAAKQAELANVSDPVSSKADSTKIAPKMARSRHNPELSRKAAEHALNKGANIAIFNGISMVFLQPEQVLPKEDFELRQINIVINKNIQTTDDDLRIYTQASELKSFTSGQGNQLSITSLAPFRNTPDLTALTIQSYGEITQQDCEAIASLTELTHVDISGGAPSRPVADLPLMIGSATLEYFNPRISNMNPVDLEAINRQTELLTLSLGFGPATDEALLKLGNLTKLQSLQMSNATVTELGLNALNADLSKTLKNLNFGPPVTTHDSSEAFRVVTRKFNAMEDLLVRGEISAEAMTEIGKLKNLRVLTLYQASLTSAHITAISQCSELTILILGNGNIGTTDIAELKKLRNLTGLKLQDNGIRLDPIIFTVLPEMNKLTKLELPESQVTPEQLEALRKKMPGCEISTVSAYP
ncbi:MAG: hypothetical protein ABL994_00610 [Verrucomicrobiales bacterium]